MKVKLASYNNSWYSPGGNALSCVLWYFVNQFFFAHGFFPVSGFKVFLLKSFGARIGSNVNIKPSVNIKYPWLLEVGSNVWIGEHVWIDNLAAIKIGDNCCLSQGAMLLTGNHNYQKPTFDLMVAGIVLEDGVWIGTKSIVCPGITCKTHAVLGVGSVASEDLEAYGIYRGNPAVKVRVREIKS